MEYKNDYKAKELNLSSASLQAKEPIITESDDLNGKVIHVVHKKQKILTDDEIKQIIADYKSGMGKTEIARKFGCNECTVRYKLRNAGIKI